MPELTGGTIDLERFWIRVKKTKTCWLWLGAKRDVTQGYGMVQVTVPSDRGPAFRTEATHRISFELANGPIPFGAYVLHSCDTRACVNPAHLRLGTHEENMADKVTRGRARKSFLPRQYQPSLRTRKKVTIRSRVRKLTNAQVVEVRTRYATEPITSLSLAKEYRLSNPMMIGVLTGRWYRDAGGPVSKIRPMVGDNAPWAKWTSQQVQEIREKVAKGQTYTSLASEYGTDKQTISDLARGNRWAHVPGPHVAIRSGHKKLTHDQVAVIRQRHAAGTNQALLAATYQVSRGAISMIVNRKVHV